MISHLVSLTLALPIGLRTSESTLSAKLSPSIHVKPSVDAKLALLAEAKAPNRRSKAMEKALLEAPTHKKAMADADAGIQGSHAQYDALKKQCVECKLAEDNVVTQLEKVISLHDKADGKLNEYNSAKAAAEEASDKATTLEGARDSACEGAPEADAAAEKEAAENVAAEKAAAEQKGYPLFADSMWCKSKMGTWTSSFADLEQKCNADSKCVGFQWNDPHSNGKMCSSLSLDDLGEDKAEECHVYQKAK